MQKKKVGTDRQERRASSHISQPHPNTRSPLTMTRGAWEANPADTTRRTWTRPLRPHATAMAFTCGAAALSPPSQSQETTSGATGLLSTSSHQTNKIIPCSLSAVAVIMPSPSLRLSARVRVGGDEPRRARGRSM
jgi:hypothetical protein